MEILNSLGWTLFQDGRTAEAVAEYERALAIDPDYVKSHNNLALALVELGRFEEAAAHYQKSLQKEPKPEIYSDFGAIMSQLGKPADAFAAYQKALELDSDCASAHFNMAVGFVRATKLEETETHYRAALRARPNAETHNGLGFVLAERGRPGEAVEQFRKAIEADPKYTPAYNNLAQTLKKQGKLEEAASYYRRSLAERPSAAVHNELGVILMKLGNKDEAAEEFAKAVALDSGYGKARRNLAALREK